MDGNLGCCVTKALRNAIRHRTHVAQETQKSDYKTPRHRENNTSVDPMKRQQGYFTPVRVAGASYTSVECAFFFLKVIGRFIVCCYVAVSGFHYLLQKSRGPLNEANRQALTFKPFTTFGFESAEWLFSCRILSTPSALGSDLQKNAFN